MPFDKAKFEGRGVPTVRVEYQIILVPTAVKSPIVAELQNDWFELPVGGLGIELIKTYWDNLTKLSQPLIVWLA